jgi:hypothetical protein
MRMVSLLGCFDAPDDRRGPTRRETNTDSWNQGAPPRVGDEIFRNGDAAGAIEGSVEVFLNVWNYLTQDEALGVWDHFRGYNAICH